MGNYLPLLFSPGICYTIFKRTMLYYVLGSVIDVEKIAEVSSQVVPLIQKGPMEGMVIVDGRPQMQSCDMPTISFSEAELKRLAEYYQGK